MCKESITHMWEILRKRRPLLQPHHATRTPSLCSTWSRSFSLQRSLGLMLHMFQKHGGQQLVQESVAQLRNLDRAACVARDTVRSRRCRRCNFCVVCDTFHGPSNTGTPGCSARRLAHRSSTSSELVEGAPRRLPPRQPASELPHPGHRSHRAGQAATRRTSQSLQKASKGHQWSPFVVFAAQLSLPTALG